MYLFHVLICIQGLSVLSRDENSGYLDKFSLRKAFYSQHLSHLLKRNYGFALHAHFLAILKYNNKLEKNNSHEGEDLSTESAFLTLSSHRTPSFTSKGMQNETLLLTPTRVNRVSRGKRLIKTSWSYFNHVDQINDLSDRSFALLNSSRQRPKVYEDGKSKVKEPMSPKPKGKKWWRRIQIFSSCQVVDHPSRQLLLI